MPELPDVEVFRKEAEKAVNKKIRDFEIIDSDFTGISKKAFTQKLKDRKFTETTRRGKTLFLSAGDDTFVVMHFGMTGELRYLSQSGESPDYTKCSFVFGNDRKLHYLSKRKLGYIELTSDFDKFIREKDLGPDVLELTEEEFVAVLREKKSMVKSAITDQSAFSGIGNIYADEILFQAGIHPKSKTGEFSESTIKTLFQKTKEVLQTAIKEEADVSRFPENYLIPHRSEGSDCPECGGKVKKIKVSGRSGYYCPHCQKK